MLCSVVHCVALCCIALQCVVTVVVILQLHYNGIVFILLSKRLYVCRSVLQCVVVY